ncbi:hypothetical protein B0O99DRAFT_596225 [Bisporella sp. PMI_857]|nr:hypothetical protein B0O99DRAFT_596225 [Bisporella sp. PMI_857]
MAPASNEEQFKFLISCIRYSNNGKVDFGQVAQECKIVSKGAAAKRYERMMRAHGIGSNSTTTKPSSTSRVPKIERRESGCNLSKKRKTDAFAEDNTIADDAESFSANAVKPDPATEKEFLRVKEEEGHQLTTDDATSLMQYYEPSFNAQYGSGSEPEYNGSDYCGPSGYGIGIAETRIGGAYGLESSSVFKLSGAGSYITSGDMDDGMRGSTGSIPRSTQNLQYKPGPCQISANNSGGSECPVIVE